MYQAKFLKPYNEKYKKVPHPRENDLTMIYFDGWLNQEPLEIKQFPAAAEDKTKTVYFVHGYYKQQN
jgi:hypothetical protein